MKRSGMAVPLHRFVGRSSDVWLTPDWFYDLCEECSPGPRLELFARRPRLGWTVWGNEVEANTRITDSGKD